LANESGAWRDEWTGAMPVLLTDVYRVAARNGCAIGSFSLAMNRDVD
jgi:hypothetical protein